MPVYMIHAEGTPLYKIGYSDNPTNRVRQLQIASPFRLTLLGTVNEPSEIWWHNIFKHKRQCGEWFLLDDEDQELFWTIEGFEYLAEERERGK